MIYNQESSNVCCNFFATKKSHETFAGVNFLTIGHQSAFKNWADRRLRESWRHFCVHNNSMRICRVLEIQHLHLDVFQNALEVL